MSLSLDSTTLDDCSWCIPLATAAIKLSEPATVPVASVYFLTKNVLKAFNKSDLGFITLSIKLDICNVSPPALKLV